MTPPRISVVMNSYNENPDWFKMAVMSYLAQVGIDLELILSTVEGDPNIPMAKKLGVKNIILNKQPGIYQQLNEGLKHITGDWFAYASSNDYAEPFKLKVEYDACTKANKLVCYSAFHRCDSKLTIMATIQPHPYDYEAHLRGNFINDCALVHKSLIKKYSPFKTKYNNKAFHDFWLRVFEGEGDVFTINTKPTWHYRKHSDSLKATRKGSASLINKNQKDFDIMIADHKKAVGNIFQRQTDNNCTIQDLSDNGYATLPAPSKETHFVYVYVAGAAKWNELAVSIASIRKNFQGGYKIFCVGDAPGVRGVIHIPVQQIKGLGSKPKDAINKLRVICNTPEIADDFVYMYDDVILLRPIDASFFDHTVAIEHVKDYTRHFDGAKGIIPDRGWRALFLRTFAALTKKKLPTYNYETHIARMLNKQKIRATFDRFGEEFLTNSLFASIYFNQHYTKPDFLLKGGAEKFKAGIYRNYASQEKLLQEIRGRIWLNYNDSAINKMFRDVVTKISKGEIKV